ncbi:MAG: hypothetical protein SFU53_07805 [Terrimicrobiaceae bacterium]|nr:hypothetical protein [Terrimicrobiaceae bacterium]
MNVHACWRAVKKIKRNRENLLTQITAQLIHNRSELFTIFSQLSRRCGWKGGILMPVAKKKPAAKKAPAKKAPAKKAPAKKAAVKKAPAKKAVAKKAPAKKKK